MGISSAVIPIFIVFSISVIREGWEDCSSAKLDKEQNNELTLTYTDGK
jgi:hypothetical protein